MEDGITAAFLLFSKIDLVFSCQRLVELLDEVFQ